MEKVERPNTLIVTLPEELSALSRNAIVDKLVNSLGVDDIDCIQFVPKCYVRITFASFSARNKAFLSGIFVESTRLFAVEADPVITDVYLEHLPAEVPNESIVEALGRFGAVHEVVDLKFAGTTIRNGTRLLKMSLASDVPVNVRILRYPCRVFYKGQPRPCSICRCPDHRAPNCPLRDVCRICHNPGHFARDCDLNAPVIANDAQNAEDDAVEDENKSVDVDGSSAGELASGDEEVLRNVDDDDDDDEDFVPDENESVDDDVGSSAEELASGDEEVLRSAPVDLPPRSFENPPVPSPSSSTPENPPVPAPSATPPAAPPVPMDTAPLISLFRPMWVKRLPDSVREMMAHLTSDAHHSVEDYTTGPVSVAFDFGVLTYRVIKETRYFEEDRFFAYLSEVVDRPELTSFVRPAVNLPPLSSDIVPDKFPSSR